MRSDVMSRIVEIPADHRHLSDARIELTAWLKAALVEVVRRDEIIADAAVVLTELAANVIDHTTADLVVLRIVVMPAAVVIEVGNRGVAGAVPDVSLWRDGEKGDGEKGDRGHGLRIVRSICRDIEISDGGQFTRIRASINLR